MRTYLRIVPLFLVLCTIHVSSMPWKKIIAAPLIAVQVHASYRLLKCSRYAWLTYKNHPNLAQYLSGHLTSNNRQDIPHMQQAYEMSKQNAQVAFAEAIALTANALFMMKKVYFDDQPQKQRRRTRRYQPSQE